MLQIELISQILQAASKAPDKIEETIENIKTITSTPTSISKKAKNAVFQFPFIISNSIQDIDTIVHIVKTNEIEYSKFILITMGLNPSLDNQDNVTIQRALSNVHTNDPKVFESADYNISLESKSINDFYKGTRLQKKPEVTNEANPYGGMLTVPEPLKQDNQLISKLSEEIFKKYSTIYNMTMINVSLSRGDRSRFEIPIGIRGIPHIVPSEEACYLVESALLNQKGLIRFIQWRTGEIKFFKDLLFRMDQVKRDEEFLKRIGRSSSWSDVLKTRAIKRKVNLVAQVLGKNEGLKPTEILPNCTLVLTLSDVDQIEKSTGINIFTDGGKAQKLMDDIMLLGIIILDTASNVAHILYSGYNKYTPTPISTLKSKNTGSGDMTNVLIDLMKKIN